jgi:hypothetical protein
MPRVLQNPTANIVRQLNLKQPAPLMFGVAFPPLADLLGGNGKMDTT